MRLSKNGGVHLVFDGGKGPVIVLLLPREFISKPIAVRSEKVQGVILPTRNGSMALVGQNGEQLQQIAQKIRQAVSWPYTGAQTSPPESPVTNPPTLRTISFPAVRPHTYI